MNLQVYEYFRYNSIRRKLSLNALRVSLSGTQGVTITHKMEEATSNGIGGRGATGKPRVRLSLQLPGFQNYEAELPEIPDVVFL